MHDNILRRSVKHSAGARSLLWSIVLAFVLFRTAAAARAETAAAPSPAAPVPALPAGSGQAASTATAGSGQAASTATGEAAQSPATREAGATAPGKFEDDPVRRGPAAVSSGDRPGARNSNGGYDVPRVLGSLVAVIGLIFLLRWAGKRLFALPTAQRSSRVVQVLSRSVLSPRQQLVLVRIGQRVIVAADNGTQLSSLSEITDPNEVASLIGQLQSEKDSGGSSARAFSSMFGRLKRAYPDGSPGDERRADGGLDETEDAGSGGAFSGERDDAENPEYAARESRGAVDRSTENVVAATRHELHGLMEKVRLISDQFGTS